MSLLDTLFFVLGDIIEFFSSDEKKIDKKKIFSRGRRAKRKTKYVQK